MGTPVNCPPSDLLDLYLQESAARHKHLCPRQILGVRMGLFGLKALGLIDEQYQTRYWNEKKRLIALLETDGCGADGICTAVNCWMVRRTAYLIDHGKMAVTLADKKTGDAVRVYPHPQARATAAQLAPTAKSRWHSYLEAYAIMPDHDLLCVQQVVLTISLDEIISRPGIRINCDSCGEEIINEREIMRDGRVLCRHCAGDSYFLVGSEEG